MYSSRLTVTFSQHFGNISVSYNYFFVQVHCKFNCQSFTGDLSLGISGKLLDVISSNMTSSLFHLLFRNSSRLNFFVVCVSQPLFYIYIYISSVFLCLSLTGFSKPVFQLILFPLGSFLISFFFLLLLISVFKDPERGFHSWYSLCLSIPLSAVLGVEEVSNSTLLFSADFV